MAVYQIPPIGPGWQIQALVARYRFSLYLQREVTQLLEDAYRAIAEQLRTAPPMTRRDRAALEDRFLEVRRYLTEAYGAAQAKTGPLLREYAALEREVHARQVAALEAWRTSSARAASAVTTTELASIGGTDMAGRVVMTGLPRQLVVSAARLDEVVRTVDVGGIGFGEWWERARDQSIARARRTIQLGVIQGKHPTQIAREIWTSGKTNAPNAWRGSRSAASAVARTVVTALQTDAQLAAEAQFPDTIRGYVFRAVLDARTSTVCRALADTEWRAGDPRMPQPPLHPNCRSTLEPLVDVPGIGRTTSQQPTYDAWLRAQSPAVQDAILGKGMAVHFREARATLADTIAIDRTPLTLAQMRTALFTSRPESYVAWIESLPEPSQRAVLGPTLTRAVRAGKASVRDVLAAAAASGAIETA